MERYLLALHVLIFLQDDVLMFYVCGVVHVMSAEITFYYTDFMTFMH